MSIQTTVQAAPEMTPGIQAPASTRLLSLDLFRGITIAAMILVNDPGDGQSAYWPLEHAKWNGWTPTDLVFPFFLFIVGVAMAFSFTSRLRRGESRDHLFKHVLWRGLILFALGVFLNGFPDQYDIHQLRIYGVLQRIAICYVITAVLELWSDWRIQVGVAVACLAGYWLIMRYIPVPGFGIPTHDMPLLDPDRNVVAWLDRKLLMGHLYEHTRDPEGLISTIPAIATSVFGLLAGKWLRSARTQNAKAIGMAVLGIVFVIVGRTWHLWFPINKKLWTSSFVLFTAGLALIFLAFFYWLVDIKRVRGSWTTPIQVFGKNAIAAYVFAEVLSALMDSVHISTALGRVPLQEYVYTRFFAPLLNPANSSLLYALVYVGICWLAMLVLYRRNMFLKI